MFRLLLIIADLIVICTTDESFIKITGAIGIAMLALSLYAQTRIGG